MLFIQHCYILCILILITKQSIKATGTLKLVNTIKAMNISVAAVNQILHLFILTCNLHVLHTILFTSIQTAVALYSSAILTSFNDIRTILTWY